MSISVGYITASTGSGSIEVRTLTGNVGVSESSISLPEPAESMSCRDSIASGSAEDVTGSTSCLFRPDSVFKDSVPCGVGVTCGSGAASKWVPVMIC